MCADRVIANGGRSASCPTCRLSVRRTDLRKLFLDIPGLDDLDDDDDGDEDGDEDGGADPGAGGSGSNSNTRNNNNDDNDREARKQRTRDRQRVSMLVHGLKRMAACGGEDTKLVSVLKAQDKLEREARRWSAAENSSAGAGASSDAGAGAASGSANASGAPQVQAGGGKAVRLLNPPPHTSVQSQK